MVGEPERRKIDAPPFQFNLLRVQLNLLAYRFEQKRETQSTTKTVRERDSNIEINAYIFSTPSILNLLVIRNAIACHPPCCSFLPSIDA